MSGTVLGTPEFMSPEQAQGRKADIGPHSDIFSLGATFYFCLTRQKPFTGNELFQVLDGVVNKDPDPPSTILKVIPKDLETICLKCLEKEPKNRYQTAVTIADDLQSYLNGESISTRRKGWAAKIWLKAKKNKIAAASLLAVFAIAIAVTAVVFISSARKAEKAGALRKQAGEYFAAQRYNDARATCEALLALAPGDPDAERLIGECTRLEKERQEKEAAEKKLAEEAAAKRAKAKAVLDRINLARNTDEKINIALDALKADPSCGEACQALGYAYKAKKDFQKAFEF
jgi:tetratricopeptide (TPR) repeat protein